MRPIYGIDNIAAEIALFTNTPIKRQEILNREEKKIHVENIIKVSDIFDDLLEKDQDILNFRPDLEDNPWTIHEHVIHCLEVDIANFTRYRAGIINRGTKIIPTDGSWTENLNYSSIDISMAIQTIKLIRKMTYDHFLTLIEDDWTKYSFLYEKYGELNFEVFAPVFYRHPKGHREFIDRNIKLFIST